MIRIRKNAQIWVATGAVVLVTSASAAAGASLGDYRGSGPDSPASSSIEEGPEADTAVLLIRGTGKASELSAETRFDLGSAAVDAGEEVEEVIKSFEGSDEFRALANGLESERPDLYVRAGFANPEAGREHAWLQLTQEPDQKLLDELAALPLTVEVTYGITASSDQIATISEAWSQVVSASGLTDYSSANYDYAEHVLRLAYQPVEGAPEDAITEVLRSALDAAKATQPNGQMPITTLINRVEGQRLATESVVSGGRGLYLDGDPECTAGFTAVREATGNRGVLTAGHCPSSLLYANLTGVIMVPVQATGSTDLQWHRTFDGHSTNKEFRATGHGAAGDRTLTTIGNALIDDYVLKWGNSSEYTGDYVKDVNSCYGSYCYLDETYEYITQDGDSGGPYFLAFSGRGIHSGNVGSGATLRSNFTRISRVADSSMGVRVLRD